MPLIHFSVPNQTPCRADGAIWDDLNAGLEASPSGPVTLMVHGYKYLPGHPRHCPHRSLLSLKPGGAGKRAVSIPKHLGLGRGDAAEGLGISFGWAARGSIWQAHGQALHAGDMLAQVLAQIKARSPERMVNIVAHSLGARVTLHALAQAEAGAVRRAVLLSAAEFASTARSALLSPAGARCEVLNVTSRENDLFDFLLERLTAAPVPGDRMMGHGPFDLSNLVTLQLDNPQSLKRLHVAGFRIAGAAHRICHWSSYVRGGVFPLYRAFLSGALPLETLRRWLPPDSAPRWSRLRPTVPTFVVPHRPFRAAR